MTWLFISIALLFALGGLLTAMRENVAPPLRFVGPPQSFLGINNFQNAEGGGVTFRDVWPPDAPADKAGLVGGDVITAFDGHATPDKDEMMRLLAITPVGKTVEISYTRDGEANKTTLTTMSRSEIEQLEGAFTNRGSSRGLLGFERGKVVPVPGKDFNGVLIERLKPNGPADLSGLAEGDIVIAFDGVPIRSVVELMLRARRAVPFSKIKLTVIRGTEQVEIPVIIGQQD